jgi:hypothetical protein
MLRNVPFLCLVAALLCLRLPVGAQSSGVPLGSPSYHILDRLMIKSGISGEIRPEIKFVARKDAAFFALAVDTSNTRLTRLDRSDLAYLINDNNEWVPDTNRLRCKNKRNLLRYFYASPANFFEVNTPDFKLRVNPMLNLSGGLQQDDNGVLFENQRGIEVRGEVDRKLFFYTNLVESQVRYPDYVNSWVTQYRSLPGAGFYKSFKPRFVTIQNGFDFNVATAYLSYQMSKHVGIQLGHGRHFIGNGYRSLLLSDVGNPAFYLKLNTRVWKFQYQNIFMELTPNIREKGGLGDQRLPKKYAAMHYLSFQINPRMHVGLFETVVFNRSRQFELQYLNPVIFYRTVEGMIGSPDNVMLGLDGHWNMFKRVQFYGQFLLDEFLAKALFDPAEQGWWGNKFGIQAGVKCIDVLGVDHLDLQIEWNRVRPFTYSHFDSLNSYTHYNQPLAHPLWSNFNEFVSILKYQPSRKIYLQGRWIHANRGDNTNKQNWGSNPLLGYNTRVQDFGNEVGQGIGASLDIWALDASWMFYHNIFVDLGVLLRRKNSEDNTLDQNTKVVKLGLRMNIWNQNRDF